MLAAQDGLVGSGLDWIEIKQRKNTYLISKEEYGAEKSCVAGVLSAELQ